jgi:hypothetical protein
MSPMASMAFLRLPSVLRDISIKRSRVQFCALDEPAVSRGGEGSPVKASDVQYLKSQGTLMFAPEPGKLFPTITICAM